MTPGEELGLRYDTTLHHNREEKPVVKILVIIVIVLVVLAVLGKLRSR